MNLLTDVRASRLEAQAPLLRDKNALIVGASGMIGTAIARLFAAQGAGLALHYHHGRERAEACARELTGAVRTPELLAGDIAQPREAERLVSEAIRALGHIDILVNAAGVARDAVVQFMTAAEWQAVLDVNLHGPFNVCRAIRPHMVSRRSGKIVNIASLTGLTGQEARTNYGASKGALIAFTKAVARELAGAGIQVNAVAPQVIEGGLSRDASPRALKDILDQTPAGRLGVGADVAYAVLYLASPMSAFVTGAVLHVNGGLVTHQV